jgi:SAM-dependent methyltransferase
LRSFDYQWTHLPEAPCLASDERWRNNVAGFIIDELETTEEKIRGRCVLDAGCGNGRWAYGFTKLGCRTFGFDASESGIRYARHMIPEADFYVANILDHEQLRSLYKGRRFDVIWCWGVLHHTGNPVLGLRNLVPLLKCDGTIHLYLYGKKSGLNHLLRWLFNRINFRERLWFAEVLSTVNGESAHSNFDGFSPPIAQECTEQQVRMWLEELGLTCKRIHPKWALESTDLFINGRLTQ